MATDYKSTVFLPRTDFPMRGNLPKREPEWVTRWDAQGLYTRMCAEGADRPPYILHDGPPYANGHIHIGHAVNKILKDVVTRVWRMRGYNAVYVPGWDCHGLPIEWKIEEGYRKAGKNKDEVPIARFRQECREFAEKWIGIQAEEFKRLGVLGDWPNPYTTMTPAAEAQIIREIHKFLLNGTLYKGSKPVLWSVVEKTALAEAELEYHDHTSTTVWVRFPLVTPAQAFQSGASLTGASVVIWTTTPWTLPGNRAIGYGEEIAYGLYEVTEVDADSLARVGERLVVATALADSVAEQAQISAWRLLETLPGSTLAGTICRHPLHGKGYDFQVPLLPGDFVTTDVGTGFVHIAPGHGEDDFILGRRHGIEVPATVDEDGRFYPHVPIFAGRQTYTETGKPGDANGAVIGAIATAGGLLARGKLVHSYPHSWRSKAPLIFRTTPQWFISMDRDDMRARCLAAIDDVRWIPEQGRNRIRSMVESRPDWCISRQRAWGVPIALFVAKADGQPLKDPQVLERIADIFATEGADAWFVRDAQDFLGEKYNAADFEQVRDIVDVWFESGSTHAFVLEARADLSWPADLYLEGSDQHRGWFQSSLLESCGTRGTAPYKAVLTHGFVLDELGRKMSKSLNNTVSPQDVNKQYGADILRLWVVGSDYSEDLRIGPEIIKYQADLYRRLRNTLRYLLGGLAEFRPEERIDAAEMPELERYIRHRLARLDRVIQASIDDYEFHTYFTELHHFCAVDLSAFYFDIRKDSLYCDRSDSVRRRSVRTVMEHLFDALTAWLAPICCFTAEEAWGARPEGVVADRPGKDGLDSVHLRRLPDIPATWTDPALAAKWDRIRAVRRVATGALEKERAEKRIGASLQAAPEIHVDADTAAMLQSVAFADVVITSDVRIVVSDKVPAGAFTLDEVPGVGVVPALAAGEKCERCWRVLPEVGQRAPHPGLCRRCADAVDHRDAAAG